MENHLPKPWCTIEIGPSYFHCMVQFKYTTCPLIWMQRSASFMENVTLLACNRKFTAAPYEQEITGILCSTVVLCRPDVLNI